MRDRRQFLKDTVKLGAAAASLSLVPRLAWADEAGKKKRGVLVAIYLRGGADALNMFIPYYDPLYYNVRPNIAIAEKDKGQERGVVALNKLFGMHPSLEPLYRFYEAGTFAPIISVGSPHASRSHFDCQDFMEYAAPGERGVTSGWLNRYLQATAEENESDFRAVATQALLPRALRGTYPVLAVPNLDRNNDPLDVFDEVYSDQMMGGGMGTQEEFKIDEHLDIVMRSGRRTIDAIRSYRELTAKVPQGEVRYPENYLARRLRDLARVIKSDCGLEVASIDYGGWDHHIQEGGFEGQMANLLRGLAESLAAFADDLGPRMEKVMVLVMSEFGRTVHENGNNGTDHGHGGCMMALGGQVKGGRIHGSWGGLEEKNLYEARDLPVITDFRLVMHEAIEKVFNVQVPRDFFPKYIVDPATRLDFLKAPT